jgi:hypothetical protein
MGYTSFLSEVAVLWTHSMTQVARFRHAMLCVVIAALEFEVLAQDDEVANPLNGNEAVGRMFTAQACADLTSTSEEKLNTTRESFDLCLEDEIHKISKFCLLTNKQRAKLELAGKGDFIHWLHRADEAREKYAGKPLDLQELKHAYLEMRLIRKWPQELSLDRDCLLQKTLKKMVTKEQKDEYAHYRQAQRIAQLESVWKYWETKMYLTRASRDKLNEILLENAPPLPRNAENREMIIILQLEEFKDRLKPVLRDSELERFERALISAHGREAYFRRCELWPVKTLDDEQSINEN